MKRIGNLYQQIYTLDNLNLADKKARKGKKHQRGVIIHSKKQDANILKLQAMLINKTYRTSAYTKFTVKQEKVREIHRLPYFPDRILHHAVMNILKPIFVSTFTADTYSCIEGRGVHKALNNLHTALRNTHDTEYYLQFDVKKFYPNINNEILKSLLRKKIKDRDMLNLLDEIIDSTKGVPLGNYLSQFLANFYLTYFDHWLKEVKGVRYYFRYCDDLVILHSDKKYLHQLMQEIQVYFTEKLKLEIKPNWRIAPVKCGLNVLGYISYGPNHKRIRKRTKKRFAKMLRYRRNDRSIASYKGWMKWCNGRHLIKKLLPQTNTL